MLASYFGVKRHGTKWKVGVVCIYESVNGLSDCLLMAWIYESCIAEWIIISGPVNGQF